MTTENYYENEKENTNEIRIGDDKLNPKQFILNEKDNKKKQELFHSVLKALVEKYNTVNEEERRKEGIFYLKNYNILLGSINKEVVQSYYNYKTLFDGLMTGKSMFFREYDSQVDNNSNKAFSENNARKKEDFFLIMSEFKEKWDYLTNNNFDLSDYKERILMKKKLVHNLRYFSFYFNGMYFESIALETFFKLIDDEYDNVNNNSELISFLPRVIFFKKNSQKAKKYNVNKKGKNFLGFSEIDCAFVFKKEEKVKIEKEKIACFNKFDIRDEYDFFNENNFVNLTIEKDNIVFLEVKSNLESFIDKDSRKNILIKFIRKALKFVKYYEELCLIQNNQKIVLIFLYNNTMHYNIKAENNNVEEAYNLIKGNERIKLYIAFFQPYMKLINSYERVKQLKNMNVKSHNQQEQIQILENEINNLKERQTYLENVIKKNEIEKNKDIETYKQMIIEMKALIQSGGKKEENCNLEKINEKDKNKKEKKNQITSGEILSFTVGYENNK